MADPEILRRSAVELGAALRKGELSCEELTRFFLERIERYDSELHAFTYVMPERALREARRRDRELRGRKGSTNNAARSPLFGVPTGIKDLVLVRGTPSRLGSRAWRYFVSPIDTPVPKLLRHAGLVCLGKLATSEYGATPACEPDIHPPTKNPWNPEYTTGGSSGGSGAAVAAGLLPLAHGSDGGGSVRIPAAFCHLYGFKPSRTFLGNLHGFVNELGLSVMGPLTRTVEDGAAMLDAMRAAVPGARDDESCLERCRRPPGPLRIGYIVESPLTAIDPEIARAVEDTARLLAELGHEVEPTKLIDVELEDFLALWQRSMQMVPTLRDGLLQPFTRWLRAEARRRKRGSALAIQRELERRVLELCAPFDVLLTPTVAVLPPRLGYLASLTPPEQFAAMVPIGVFTAGFNISGQPAATLPAGIGEPGRPYGVQLAGKPGSDPLLLALSRQLEEARPWDTQIAPEYRPQS